MRTCVALALALAGIASGEAPTLAIIHVDRTGYCEVSGGQLPPACLKHPIHDLAMRDAQGRAVGLQVLDDGDGSLGPIDRLRWFAQANPSPHTAMHAYQLRTGGSQLELPATAEARQVPLAPESYFGALPTSDLSVLDGLPPIDHWFVCRLPPAATVVRVPLRLPAGGHPRAVQGQVPVEIVLQGGRHSAASNRVRVCAGETGEGDGTVVSWTGARPHTTTLSVAAARLEAGEATLELTNLNPRQHFNLVGTNLDEVYLDQVRLATPLSYRLADQVWTGPARVVAPLGSSRERLLAGGADFLVITRGPLAEPLAPLLDWRRAGGLRPRVVLLEEILEAFHGGEYVPGAIRAFLREARDRWQPPPRYLLLVGDADRDTDRVRPFESVPTCIVEICGDGGAASDVAHALLDDDPFPDLAVGRFPARTAAEVARLVESTIAYERDLPPGVWRREVALILGEGRFGARVDQALEQMATTMVGSFIPPHLDVSVTFASPGSPYVVAPERFNQTVINRVNAGPALVAYVGHGSPRSLDRLRWEGRRYPILASEHVPEIDCGPGRPVMFIIACSTGHLDDPERSCIAEDLILRPRGPVALIAASRVSYPYPNALLAKEIIDVFLRQGVARLGDGLHACRRLLEEGQGAYRQMIDMAATSLMPAPERMARERLDQILLYNLLGDPALQLALPRGRVRLRAPADLQPGEEAEILGAAVTDGGTPVPAGRVLLTLEIVRTEMLHPLEPLDGLEGEERLAAIARNYERANDKVAAVATGEVEQGTFRLRLEAPADLRPGSYVWKVYVASGAGDAAGSSAVRVGAEPAASPEPPSGDDEGFY
jgi:hypothetical protein